MLNKKDFIEIEFTAKTKEGELFDSNIKGDLEKINPNIEAKPFIFSLGEGMFLKGVEDFLIGKSFKQGENFKIELSPEKAFGNRNAKLIQRIPLRIFMEQKLNPVRGVMFNFDGRIAKVLSSSGGRVLVDFNNPIAGKNVVYNVKILRKVDDINEKAKSFINFLFRRDFKFQIKEGKIIVEAEKQFVKFVELFAEKFKDALGLSLEVKESTEEEKDKGKSLKSQ